MSKKRKDLISVKECHQLVTAGEGCEGVNTGSRCKSFIPFDNKAVAIVENVVCCVKFSAARAVGPISGGRVEVEGVPARPGRQARVAEDGVVSTVVGTGDRCPVGIPLKEYPLLGEAEEKILHAL
jgi:hypothetical protein